MNEFELEREQSREEVAAYLRKLADGLENDSKVTFIAGEESATINPPDSVYFRMETSADSSWIGGDDGQSFVLELGWETEEAEGDEELTIVNQKPTKRSARGGREA